MGNYDESVDVIIRAASDACNGDLAKMFSALMGAFGKLAAGTPDPDAVISVLEATIRAARRAHAEGVPPEDGAAISRIFREESGVS